MNNKSTIPMLIFTVLITIIAIAIVIGAIMSINGSQTEETAMELNEIKIALYKKEIGNVEVEKKSIIIEIEDEESTNKVEINKTNDVNKNAINNTSNNTEQNKSNSNESVPKYYIKVNYDAQVVNVYTKDSKGNYTVPVKAMICSTGDATPTSGVYSIQARWTWLPLFNNVYGQYTTQIVGNILFHSVPYTKNGDTASLEYWEYDKLGEKASLGCIRLTVEDAKWIFDNCSNGTKVEFYSDSNPGPLGKPSAKKISNAGEELRNWDPTDPNSKNPWKRENSNVDNKTEQNTVKNNTTNKNTITTKVNSVVNYII